MPEDLCLCCLFPLITGPGAFTLWGLRWAIGCTRVLGCSPGRLLVPWSSRYRKDLVRLLPSPVLRRQKAAHRRWMEASAMNPSRDTALLLIRLQYTVVCSRYQRRRLWLGQRGEHGPAPHERLLVDAPAPASGRGNIFGPPRMVTPMAMSSVVPFPATHLGSPYFLKERRNCNLLPGFLLPGHQGQVEPGSLPGVGTAATAGTTPPQAPGGCRRDAPKLPRHRGAGFTQREIHPAQSWTQAWPRHPQETGDVGEPRVEAARGWQEVRQRGTTETL